MPLRRPISNAENFVPDDADGIPDEEGVPDVYGDDDDEAPAKPSSLQAKSGWDAARKIKDATSVGGSDFKWTEEQQLIKFLDDDPVYSYAQHWVDGAGERRSYQCLGARCPLCDAGIKARARFAFSVVVIGDEVSGPVVLWCGPKAFEDVAALASARTGPLTRHFYAVHKTGEKLRTKYHIAVVRGRDLADEWNLDLAEVEAECAKLKPHTEADLAPEKSTRAELMELVKQLG